MSYTPPADRSWPPKMPETIEDVAELIEQWADRIFVRDMKADGEYGPIALSELPLERALHHAFRFILAGRVPVMLKPGE